jgi:hypothetical protein
MLLLLDRVQVGKDLVDQSVALHQRSDSREFCPPPEQASAQRLARRPLLHPHHHFPASSSLGWLLLTI